MFNYIKADLYRLFSKRSNYIFYGALAGLFLFILMIAYQPTAEFFAAQGTTSNTSQLYFMLGILILSLGGFMTIGAQSYYTVFLDDLSVKNLPTLFTTGLKKHDYVLAKIIVQAIYLFIVLAFVSLLYITGYFVLQTNIENPLFDATHIWIFLQAVGIMYFGTLAYSVISSLIGYLFQRSDIAIISFFILVNGLIMQTLSSLSNINALSFLENIVDFSLTEVLETGFTNRIDVIVEGTMMTSAFYEVILISLTYLVVFAVLSWLLLRQVEIKD